MYRGMSMNKETFKDYEYHNLYSPDQDAIVSFSKKKRNILIQAMKGILLL